MQKPKLKHKIYPYAATGKEGSEPVPSPDAEMETPPLNMDVCLGANYFKTGEDPVIRPESEYPEWLWKLQTEKQQLGADASKLEWRRFRKKQAHKVMATLREKR